MQVEEVGGGHPGDGSGGKCRGAAGWDDGVAAIAAVRGCTPCVKADF